MADSSAPNVGKIIEIKGVVIDAVFPDQLPEILSALEIAMPGGTLIAEVQQHLGDDRVRAVAMDATDGLARGVEVVDTGAPISVPVGAQTLGRLWNVIGEPIDDKPAPEGGERWPIHRDPPAFRAKTHQGRHRRDGEQDRADHLGNHGSRRNLSYRPPAGTGRMKDPYTA